MSRYVLAKYSTTPEMIHFACENEIKENPMYMKCGVCPNRYYCDIKYLQDFNDVREILKRVDNPNYDIEEGVKLLKQLEYENSLSSFIKKLKNFFIKILIGFVIFVILFLLS